MKILPVVSLLALLAPATAGAATVTVPEPNAVGIVVHITAAPGETNHVTVQVKDRSGSEMMITDSGATLTASAPCANVDEHTVTCTRAPGATGGYTQTLTNLGDGDDSFDGGTRFSSDDIFAGPGNDTINAGPGYDEIDGGGGRDTLRGGSDGDEIVDGDAVTTIDRDVLDGGEDGGDLIDYSARTDDLDIDLYNHMGGAETEGDRVTGFERASGGAGNDRIAGTGEPNVLEGNAGNDVLTGRGGNDHNDLGDDLYGGDGDDWLRGTGGNESFYGAAGVDRFRCRGGRDFLARPELGEFIGSACERATFPVGEEDSHTITPNPVDFNGAVAVFVGTCPNLELDEGEPPTCSANAVLRHATGAQQVLGRGKYALDQRDTTKYAVRLTGKGRRLARRKEGVVVNVTLKGKGVPRIRYTIKLSTRP